MKSLMFGFLFLMFVGFGMAASSDPSFCCERTNAGAWCVNDAGASCNSAYTSAPTGCDSTSYCRLGTCYDSVEGICMENTAQRTCNDNGGTWDERGIEDVPQCQLGCCVIADQAAFVSLVRCKRLSTLFGIENDYRTDITNEVNCIAEAQSQDVGACVFEEDFERTCKFTTRGECGAGEEVEALNQTNLTITTQRTFYEDFLCSAEELNTACARQSGTTCDGGDVYWTDSCGNKENVYSSDKAQSWNNGRVAEANEVCSASDGSDINCGNCDYLLGSRCAEFEGIIGGPSGSDHYCQKTECIDRDGEKRINGESWCVYDSPEDSIGARYFREICTNGEVRVEPCADFRNEVCLEGSIDTSVGEFGTAACRVNRWQDCVLQTESDDCMDEDRRDCEWLPAVTGMNIGAATSTSESSGGSGTYSNPTGSESGSFGNPTGDVVAPITGKSILGGGDGEEETTISNRPDGVCVPKHSPGLNFWDQGSATQICGQASARCIVVIEEGLLGGEEVVQGAECLTDSWGEAANNVCTSLGDCGGAVNYDGAYNGDGYKWVVDGGEKTL